jgi:hypothetical protein
MTVPADDHVVVDSDAKQVANLDHLLGRMARSLSPKESASSASAS